MEHQVAVVCRAVGRRPGDFQVKVAGINLPGKLHPVTDLQMVAVRSHLADDARSLVGDPRVELFLGDLGFGEQWQRPLWIHRELREAGELLVALVKPAVKRERRGP